MQPFCRKKLSEIELLLLHQIPKKVGMRKCDSVFWFFPFAIYNLLRRPTKNVSLAGEIASMRSSIKIDLLTPQLKFRLNFSFSRRSSAEFQFFVASARWLSRVIVQHTTSVACHSSISREFPVRARRTEQHSPCGAVCHLSSVVTSSCYSILVSFRCSAGHLSSEICNIGH